MKKLTRLIILLLSISLLAGCQQTTPSPTLTVESPTAIPPTHTPQPPTATPLPQAARINGVGILLTEFEAEIQRQQAAAIELGIESTPQEIFEKALNDLIGQTLLAQAAYAAGFQISESELQARIDTLAAEMGGSQTLVDWQTANFYTPETFAFALQRQLAGLWQRDQILAGVPATAEQVHARQILVRQQETADEILRRVKAGSDFASLAWDYDPLTGGELGWFSRGMLTQPAVEEAAFSLQPGEVSGIIQSDLGFHIIQVIEREASRPLLTEVYQQAQLNALEQWVEQQKNLAQIEILVQP
jgi:peptidyl-prolyl cis-trans isomerase C